LFMGSQERLRYELQKGDTVAMYFDLMQIVWGEFVIFALSVSVYYRFIHTHR
jgi:hypothetical protein